MVFSRIFHQLNFIFGEVIAEPVGVCQKQDTPANRRCYLKPPFARQTRFLSFSEEAPRIVKRR
jgi:hypothetical protein